MHKGHNLSQKYLPRSFHRFKMRIAIASLFALVCISQCMAEIKFANTLGDDMVLQQAPARPAVWGTTIAYDNVTVSLDGKELGATAANAAGEWKYNLPATTASFTPHVIGVVSTDNSTANITNVLFGDVWLCGGQSNMGIPLSYVDNAAYEVKETARYPNIRVFHVRESNTSLTPYKDLIPHQVQMAWTAPSNASVAPSNMEGFSAVCWFFGVELFFELEIPIGLVQDQWGGTPVQAWSDKDALAACEREEVAEIEIAAADAAQPSQSTPSVLWNAMIYPFIQMSIKGAIWYQGEANVNGADEWGPEFYKCGFPAMITSWRKFFPAIPFLYVQLAPYCNKDSHCNGAVPVSQVDYLIPALREAQLDTLTAVDLVGMAVAGDLGDQTAPAGSVHPRHKKPVGERLAANAIAIAYNRPSWPHKGPQPVRATVSGTTVTISFDPTFNYGGLVPRAAQCPAGGMQPASCTGSGFEVFASKGGAVGWHHATSDKIVDSSTVEVTCDGATDIRDIRYAYADWPLMTVFNNQDFPLGQFFLSVSSDVEVEPEMADE